MNRRTSQNQRKVAGSPQSHFTGKLTNCFICIFSQSASANGHFPTRIFCTSVHVNGNSLSLLSFKIEMSRKISEFSLTHLTFQNFKQTFHGAGTQSIRKRGVFVCGWLCERPTRCQSPWRITYGMIYERLNTYHCMRYTFSGKKNERRLFQRDPP